MGKFGQWGKKVSEKMNSVCVCVCVCVCACACVCVRSRRRSSFVCSFVARCSFACLRCSLFAVGFSVVVRCSLLVRCCSLLVRVFVVRCSSFVVRLLSVVCCLSFVRLLFGVCCSSVARCSLFASGCSFVGRSFGRRSSFVARSSCGSYCSLPPITAFIAKGRS